MRLCIFGGHFFIHMYLLIIVSEAHDRTDIDLPGGQGKLIETIKEAIPSTTPLIVVVMAGGPVDISAAKVKITFFTI